MQSAFRIGVVLGQMPDYSAGMILFFSGRWHVVLNRVMVSGTQFRWN